MRTARRLLVTTAITALLASAGAAAAHADYRVPSPYDTPGTHTTSDRAWRTSCEMYSSTVVRCRTEIWASQVAYSGGAWRVTTGWHFNNLTYLPSERSTWSGNPLAASGTVGGTQTWTSNGKKWKTECDTAATGRGACRSYMWRQVASLSGQQVNLTNRWVFNNIVTFSSATAPPITRVPDQVLDQSRLTPTGFGPLQVGTSMSTLKTAGYMAWRDLGECEAWVESAPLKNRGISTTWDKRLTEVIVQNNSGVRVAAAPGQTGEFRIGMTLGQLKAMHPGKIQLVTKNGYSPVHAAVLSSGTNEIVFVSSFDLTRPLRDSDVITVMVARTASEWLGWDGC